MIVGPWVTPWTWVVVLGGGILSWGTTVAWIVGSWSVAIARTSIAGRWSPTRRMASYRGTRWSRRGHLKHHNLVRLSRAVILIAVSNLAWWWQELLKVLHAVGHLGKLHEVLMELPLIGHGLLVSTHLLVFRDGVDQGAVFVQHLLALSSGGGTATRRSVDRSGARRRPCTIGVRRSISRRSSSVSDRSFLRPRGRRLGPGRGR